MEILKLIVPSWLSKMVEFFLSKQGVVQWPISIRSVLWNYCMKILRNRVSNLSKLELGTPHWFRISSNRCPHCHPKHSIYDFRSFSVSLHYFFWGHLQVFNSIFARQQHSARLILFWTFPSFSLAFRHSFPFAFHCIACMRHKHMSNANAQFIFLMFGRER